MQNLQFPIRFRFKISTFSNDFTATDATGKLLAYVRQKMFKFKEDILIYSDETKAQINFRIKADRWLDFSAAYGFFDGQGQAFGKVVRKGWRSIWKAEYQLIDQNDNLQYHIKEENAWAKVLDAMFSEIPLIGIFAGYVFNPKYIVTDANGQIIVRLKKMPSFFGREFEIDKIAEFDTDDADRIMLGLMMMILLERRRG